MMHMIDEACALYAGYHWGRHNSIRRLVDWAGEAVAPGWRTWRFWPAAPIVTLALAYLWIAHPRRTLANHRAYNDDKTEM
jgi:hypothetical protein